MRHTTKTRQAALRLLGRPGYTLGEIAAITGTTRRTLQAWARAAGLPPRVRGARPSIFGPAVRRRAVGLYLAGTKMRTISAQVGACAHEIRKWVRAAGHPLRTTHTCGRLSTARVVALANRFGSKGAAEILGCSVGSVGYHRAKARRASHAKA